jgi:hypothetical protein
VTIRSLNNADRRALRSALSSAIPWLAYDEAGPTTVDAGPCDRCHDAPRLVPTCGPVPWRALCRTCTTELGIDAWCDGHAEDGDAVLRWLADLPEWWADAVMLWWVATGELAWDGSRPSTMPTVVQHALPAPHAPRPRRPNGQ